MNGKVIAGLLCAIGAGIAAGMCVPDERKPKWTEKGQEKAEKMFSRCDKERELFKARMAKVSKKINFEKKTTEKTPSKKAPSKATKNIKRKKIQKKEKVKRV